MGVPLCPLPPRGISMALPDGGRCDFAPVAAPSILLPAWKPKCFSLRQAQSALTSTTQALQPSCLPPSLARALSDCLQGEPSCLTVGITPLRRQPMLQAKTLNRASAVVRFAKWRFRTAVRGILISPPWPCKPGKLMLIVSTDSVLSQLQGVPSIQIPRPRRGPPTVLPKL